MHILFVLFVRVFVIFARSTRSAFPDKIRFLSPNFTTFLRLSTVFTEFCRSFVVAESLRFAVEKAVEFCCFPLLYTIERTVNYHFVKKFSISAIFLSRAVLSFSFHSLLLILLIIPPPRAILQAIFKKTRLQSTFFYNSGIFLVLFAVRKLYKPISLLYESVDFRSRVSKGRNGWTIYNKVCINYTRPSCHVM